MYKRRKPRRIEASFLFVFWVSSRSLLEGILSFVFPKKLSCNTDLSVASNFCCGETEPRKLHTPPTYMVPFFGFNLAETTLSWPPRDQGQAQFSSVQFSSVAQLCLTLCHPMNRSTSGLPVHHQLPEFTKTHVHRAGDAIQPSHPLLSPSPAPNPSQHQSLFQ